MTFTQHVERPKIKNSCHHHQVNFSYLWVVVVVVVVQLILKFSLFKKK